MLELARDFEGQCIFHLQLSCQCTSQETRSISVLSPVKEDACEMPDWLDLHLMMILHGKTLGSQQNTPVIIYFWTCEEWTQPKRSSADVLSVTFPYIKPSATLRQRKALEGTSDTTAGNPCSTRINVQYLLRVSARPISQTK